MGVRTKSVVIGTGSYTVVTSCTLSPRREPDGDESEREGHPLPGPARGAERISDSQPVGRRLGANPGRARLPGPGDLERRRGRRPRPARRHRVPRRGAGARARDRGRGRSSRLRRSREVLRRRAGRRRRHDPSRRRGRPGRRLDRGRDRRQGPAALRHRARHRARGRGRPGGALAQLPLHADRADGELPARQPEPRRHDQASAGLREGGRRRADGAGPARPRLGARGVRRGEEAGQLHGRHQGQVVHGGRAPGRRREAHQRGLVVLSRRDDRAARRGPRTEGQGHVRVPRPLDRDARPERVHVVKVTAVTPFVVDPGYGKNWLFVKVETSDGLHGWGECYTQADRDHSIAAHARQLGRYLLGRDASHIRHFTHWAYNDFASKRGSLDFWGAVSGIEQALWDLAGKRLGARSRCARRVPARDQDPDRHRRRALHALRVPRGVRAPRRRHHQPRRVQRGRHRGAARDRRDGRGVPRGRLASQLQQHHRRPRRHAARVGGDPELPDHRVLRELRASGGRGDGESVQGRGQLSHGAHRAGARHRAEGRRARALCVPRVSRPHDSGPSRRGTVMNPFETSGLGFGPANFTPLTPVAFLPRTAAVHPDRVAVIHGDRRITYRDFYARARRLASTLAARGIGAGDTVSVMLPNVPAMLDAHYGVPMAGATLHPITTRRPARTIAYILGHGEAKALITDREFAAVVGPALEQLGRKLLVIDVDDPLYDGPGGTLGATEYEAFLAEGSPDFEWRPPRDESQAIALNYTSGTTGNPKGVVYHHRGTFLVAVGNVLAWDLPPRAVYLWTLPLFHCNGWCYSWAVTLVGGTHVCLRKVDPPLVFRLIAEHRVTNMCGAATP